MDQLGKALPRLITAMATIMPLDSPLFLAKWDIKDGFWRLLVPPEHAWHFCYVMPRLPNQPIQIVLPASLQMGWCESPRSFVRPAKQPATSHNST